MSPTFGPRRAQWLSDLGGAPLSADELQAYERLDGIYRALCAMLYNYAPMSGHPGGSISSGRFVSMLLFDSMDYDFGQPDREDADIISYAAGHKALGLYAMWALRNEIVRLAAPALMPQAPRDQLRLEDLLGFRRNPQTATPLFKQHGARALDGHPTPATPFVKLSTGASGVGLGSSLGLAVAMADWFGPGAPRLHVVEGEGGLTPGRVSEALAFAGTASLGNAVVHVDWNQASIDSERVTREGDVPGDYVQWDPAELFYLHDWNVISVADGMDFQAIAAAQQKALALDNGQPTAIVYRTVKGWKYGIEGRASHGAGHKLCSPGFYASLPLPESARASFPKCSPDDQRCAKGSDALEVERCFYDGLLAIRRWVEDESLMTRALAARLVKSRERLDAAQRQPRAGAPRLADAFALTTPGTTPPELALAVGTDVTLRGQLGKALGTLNTRSGGAVLLSAADLLGSTSLGDAAKGFEAGFFNAQGRSGSRVLSVGGICEDASAAVLSGIAAFGHHLGAAASYGAFLAPLGHIAARLHAIGSQARHERLGTATTPMILVCAHAGLKTGEDGPTHADPQPLQLFQENFPPGAMVTLTPWDPAEIWPLLSTALAAKASGHRAVRHPAQRGRAGPRGAGAGAGERGGAGRLPAAAGAREGRRDGGAAGVGRRLRLPHRGAAAAGARRPRRGGLLRGQRRAVRPAAGRGARAHLPRGHGHAGDGHHRLHAGHDVPVGSVGRRARGHAAPVREGALPRVGLGPGGDCRGRAGWRESVRAHRGVREGEGQGVGPGPGAGAGAADGSSPHRMFDREFSGDTVTACAPQSVA